MLVAHYQSVDSFSRGHSSNALPSVHAFSKCAPIYTVDTTASCRSPSVTLMNRSAKRKVPSRAKPALFKNKNELTQSTAALLLQLSAEGGALTVAHTRNISLHNVF